jgi:peptidoglycan hydrolase-like protein with peptidoglycan-binding domain
VRAAEKLLRRAGFSPGAVDGTVTPALTRALTELQAAWQLPQTGLADAATLSKLRHVSQRMASSSKGLVSIGQKSGAIATMERRLETLGSDVGRADGVFSRETFEAVKAFKNDQPDIRNDAGALGRRGQRILREEVAALRHEPFRRRLAPTAVQKQLDARTTRAASRGIGPGETGSVVVNVQRHLRAAGYDPQRVLGQFDERTGGAVKAFQRASDLPETGVVDARTWRRLKTSLILSNDAASPAQALGERSGAVKKSERLLKTLGFDPGKVDGHFTKATENAVKAFERKHDLERDGRIGERQLEKMTSLAKSRGGIQVTNEMRRLVANGRSVALSMGGYRGLGLCATGVSRAIERTMGFRVWGNGNQIDNNLPRQHFRQVNLSLAEALKIPGLILTWERTPTALGSKYGHTAITVGDGRSSTSDFIESNTLHVTRYGLKVFVPLP